MTRRETIHTENSHKYGPRDAYVLLRAGGWSPLVQWTDEEELFSLILATAGADASIPASADKSAFAGIMDNRDQAGRLDYNLQAAHRGS